jgi:hypothetical protein
MGFLFDILFDALLHTFLQPVVDPLIDPLVDPIARRYKRRLGVSLLVVVWLVTFAAMWFGMTVALPSTRNVLRLLGVVLTLGMPFFALMSTLVLRDKMRDARVKSLAT